MHIIVKILVECLGLHLAQSIRNRNNLVLSKFDGTSLMNINMTRTNADNTLILIEHGVNGGSIGLCTASQKEYLRIGHADSFADTLFGTFREFVEAIRCRLGIIILDKIGQHLRVCPVIIVTFE